LGGVAQRFSTLRQRVALSLALQLAEKDCAPGFGWRSGSPLR